MSSPSRAGISHRKKVSLNSRQKPPRLRCKNSDCSAIYSLVLKKRQTGIEILSILRDLITVIFCY